MFRRMCLVLATIATALAPFALPAQAAYHFSDFEATPPIHLYQTTSAGPKGLSPAQVKSIYDLPSTGGHGTIAIIDAYNDKTIETDLASFDKQFGLAACTKTDGCLTQHLMSASESTNNGWAMETSLDVEWAHAIAPNAKILLVEATTQSGTNLINAVDYATSTAGVVAVSMSWGGPESSDEKTMDSHFSKNGIAFFASAGDNGTGASWPAASPNVIGVGGTSLALNSNGTLKTETAWSGSGGGVSAYESEPSYQTTYSIPRAGGMRAIPDVSFDADPASGFSVIDNGTWETVGGTSAGAPQWAAITSLGSGANNPDFYQDKSSANNAAYFRDIKSGTNGSCGYFCTARAHYDYVTGLGSPLTTKF